MHALRGTYSQAFMYLERLQTVFQVGEEGDPSIEAEWLVLQSLMLNMQGRPTEGIALTRQALEIAPEADSRVRSLAYFGLAGAYQLMEDYARAAASATPPMVVSAMTHSTGRPLA
jgi:ATP/maltotriose-dependent transcriptional regulator MalT